MTMLSLNFIIVLSCISALCLGTGVADTCSAPASTVCITGQPGPPGPQGPPGPPSTLSDVVIEQLAASIAERVRIEMSMSCKLGSARHPAASCQDIYDCDPTAPSGHYWVNTTTGIRQMFCSPDKIIDCSDAMVKGYKSGVYTIHPIKANTSFNVYCDMETDGGGWTVLMKRQDGSVDFYRNWADYKRGFGNLEGEHWLGLDNMYLLTNLSSDPPQLRVDLADWEGNTAFAKYDQFSVGNEDSDYILSVSGYQSASTAGDSLTYPHNSGYGRHNGQRFSTPDRENDVYPNLHCAVYFHGPWWHRRCYYSLLTGKYFPDEGPRTSTPRGIIWYTWLGDFYSLRYAEMKIRPGGM